MEYSTKIKKAKDFMLVLCLDETIDQSAMAKVFVGMVMCWGGRMVMLGEGD